MSKLTIRTCDEFEIALRAVPFAEARLAAFEMLVRGGRSGNPRLRPYALWNALLTLVQEAIDGADWQSMRALLEVYEGVERVGPRSEMFEASYVAFIEDVRLPLDRVALHEFLRNATKAFGAAIKEDRGLR